MIYIYIYIFFFFSQVLLPLSLLTICHNKLQESLSWRSDPLVSVLLRNFGFLYNLQINNKGWEITLYVNEKYYKKVCNNCKNLTP